MAPHRGHGDVRTCNERRPVVPRSVAHPRSLWLMKAALGKQEHMLIIVKIQPVGLKMRKFSLRQVARNRHCTPAGHCKGDSGKMLTKCSQATLVLSKMTCPRRPRTGDRGRLQPVTACSRHMPGTPFNSCSPCSVNSIPEPTMLIRTVSLTSS